jgi:hypothetical protein
MNVIDLQNELIRQIPKIKNISTLESLKLITNQNQTPVVLTEFQKKLIAKSEEDIITGLVVEHSVAMNRIAQN